MPRVATALLIACVGCRGVTLREGARAGNDLNIQQPRSIVPETALEPEQVAAPPAEPPAKPSPLKPRAGLPQGLPDTSPAERMKALVKELDPEEAGADAAPLLLDEVVASVSESFPLIQSALQEMQVAGGKQLSTRGVFDLKVQVESINAPQGFYENYRHLAKIEQPTWRGGSVYGQYRLGDGDFQPWYGERETNEGGEFKAGLAQSLLRGRLIDQRRADVLKADLQAAAVEPAVQAETLGAVRAASHVYWSWVAAGQAYIVTRELLEVAQERAKAIARQVELGNLAATENQQNDRLIASREAKLIETRRKLQGTAIKLSLFLRDAEGRPVVPSPAMLPASFPPPADPDVTAIDAGIERAITQRPELRELALQRESAQVDLTLGQNDLLPTLSAIVEASQDVGAAASSKGDKSPFELEAGLLFDVPLQRRKARGTIQSAGGKLTQISLKRGFATDKIAAEVQDAVTAQKAAFERYNRAKQSVKLARELVAAEYRNFELGNGDVLRIAIQEAAELDAQIMEIDALLDYFQAVADYRAALGESP